MMLILFVLCVVFVFMVTPIIGKYNCTEVFMFLYGVMFYVVFGGILFGVVYGLLTMFSI